MTSSRRRTAAAAFFLTGLLLATARDTSAQTRTSRPGRPGEAGAAAGQAVTIRKVEGVGRKAVLKTPEFRHNLSPSIKRPQDWAEAKVLYDTSAEWIDEVTIQFFVLSENRSKGKVSYTLYRKTIRNMDVERGDGHMAAVYLSPSAVKRFGAPVAVAVEVTAGGKPAGSMSEIEKGVKLPDELTWWKSEKVTQSEGVTIRDDYLLTREQSPFALVAVDDYEGTK